MAVAGVHELVCRDEGRGAGRRGRATRAYDQLAMRSVMKVQKNARPTVRRAVCFYELFEPSQTTLEFWMSVLTD